MTPANMTMTVSSFTLGEITIIGLICVFGICCGILIWTRTGRIIRGQNRAKGN